jgi:hypothetical protein
LLAVKRASASNIRCRRRAQLPHSLSLLTALYRTDDTLDKSDAFLVILIAPRRPCKAREQCVHC